MKRTVTAILALTLTSGGARAHHGYAAIFNASQKLTIAGTLTKVDWRNPHILFVLDAKNDEGRVQRWTIEAAPPMVFARHGVTKVELQTAIGTIVNVQAYCARDGSLFGSLLKITFADGKTVINDPAD